jgi:dihydrodipicolinate synthase/N-acetylneuraminate lyase
MVICSHLASLASIIFIACCNTFSIISIGSHDDGAGDHDHNFSSISLGSIGVASVTAHVLSALPLALIMSFSTVMFI